jgi:spore coat polysaccharide biosynthesis protein SpsF (cytidylyltransferase family)
MIKTAIGIQARLASTRLEQKSFRTIGNKNLVDHIIDRVSRSVDWFQRKNPGYKSFEVCLLVPEEEKIEWMNYKNNSLEEFRVIAGPMDNVFQRYVRMAEILRPDYIARLTADCPFIPSPLISKMISLAIKNRYDYLTNSFEEVRTMLDGHDCEVMSIKCFAWLARELKKNPSPEDLEHVTTYLKRNWIGQAWMRKGVMSTNLDYSDQKESVDTIEDFLKVKKMHESKVEKDMNARQKGLRVYEY